MIASGPANLAASLDELGEQQRGHALEGAGMAAAILDVLSLRRGRRLRALLAGPGRGYPRPGRRPGLARGSRAVGAGEDTADLAPWGVTSGDAYVPAPREATAAPAPAREVPAAVLPGGRRGEPER